MSKAENQVYKRTFGHGKTKVTSYLPPDHPVSIGISEAEQILGGTFPEHVGKIRILPDTKRKKDGRFVLGECYTENSPSSRSSIKIYGGSITEVNNRNRFWSEQDARDTLLHEIGHSHQAVSEQAGGWLASQPSKQALEDDADRFAHSEKSKFNAQRHIRTGLTNRQRLDQLKKINNAR